MKHHPEQQDDEIYMGNASEDVLWKSTWRTIRFGGHPLMRDGTRYTGGGGLLPWFIKRSEVEYAINDRNRSAFQGMLDSGSALTGFTVPK